MSLWVAALVLVLAVCVCMAFVDWVRWTDNGH